MKQVFVDTGGWYAHLVPEDIRHTATEALFQQAEEDDWVFVTTDAVVFEAYALLVNRARAGRPNAISMLDLIDAGLATMIHVTKDDVARSIDLVHVHQDKTYSLCDASSFVVMNRLGIRDVISFDDHFRQYGRFNVL